MHFPLRLREDAKFDVVGFGTNAVDHLVTVAEYPRFNSKVEFSRYTIAAGGEVATTLVGLQRLGLRTAYAGRFGEDEAGNFGLQSLCEEGVDTTHAETVPGALTQLAFIIIDERTGERTIIWRRDPKLAYTSDEAPIVAAAQCKILHMTVHDIEGCIRMAETAKANGAIVSIDIDRVDEGIEDLLPLVDILISSADLPQQLTGSTDRKAALRGLHHRYSCAVTGATLGLDGSILFCDGRFVETPAFEVPGGCTDTTGAGDAFRSGFLYGVVTGRPVDESADIANAVAALKCRKLGARTGLPTVEDLRSFIKTSRRRQR
jgi:sugar/nucleoside kinase (ribokinase family)